MGASKTKAQNKDKTETPRTKPAEWLQVSETSHPNGDEETSRMLLDDDEEVAEALRMRRLTPILLRLFLSRNRFPHPGQRG